MTIDKSRLPLLPATLPDFTSVPRRNARHDGWTPERQQRFIEALADTGTVKSAALAVNMSSESAYQLRRHPGAAAFSRAWDKALSFGMQRLRDLARERAIEGIEVPIVYHGEIVGTRRQYDSRLLTFAIAQDDKKQIAAMQAEAARASNPATRRGLARLRKQLRQEWESEHAMATWKAENDQFDGLHEALGEMHRRWFTVLGPRARQAYLAFRLAEAAEQNEPCDRPEDQDESAYWAREHEACREQYDTLFGKDRRPAIWQAIDVVFGSILAGLEQAKEKAAGEGKRKK